MSEQARYLQQCRLMWGVCIRFYGASHKQTKFWDEHCKREAGHLISGASGLWGFAR